MWIWIRIFHWKLRTPFARCRMTLGCPKIETQASQGRVAKIKSHPFLRAVTFRLYLVYRLVNVLEGSPVPCVCVLII